MPDDRPGPDLESDASAVKERIDELGRRALANERLDRPDAMVLARAGGDCLPNLFAWAHQVRCRRFGDEVKFCSIAAGKTGACSEDCKWCAQSVHYHTHIPAQLDRADAAGLVRAADQAAGGGAASFGIVNSGLRPSPHDLSAVAEAAEAIATDGRMMPCASLGLLDDRAAAQLRAMGVRRYNHNLETSRRRYGELVTTHDYDSRLATLAAARRAGLSLCCGGIFGVGETWEDRIDLALTLRDAVEPDVVPLNFLHPIPGTPMEHAPRLTPMECLHIIAVFRLLLPSVDLKIAGGRQVNLRELQSWMFYAGATSCLVGNYLTTVGRDVQADVQLVNDLGLTLVRRFSHEPAEPARATLSSEAASCRAPS